MEKESFEDQDVSELLNKYFISIKVDREERPDIDYIYMSACESLTGSGGWPLTIFMTSDKKPFFAGTYFPKHNKMGMMGLLSILENVRKAWVSNREYLLHTSNEILKAINQQQNDTSVEFKPDLLWETFSQFKDDYDCTYGGFGNAPKFPTPHNLYFLLRYWYKTKDNSALEMVENTLDSMYKGGIFDHIGYGFCRYSTDRKWLVPHFEKMLYDNALISIAYLETYQITRNPKYSQVAKEIFTYVLRDMTSKEGGFYSAEDADSEGEEGKFYVWTVDEIKEILGEEDGDNFCAYFDITSEGNFEGKNIPNLIKWTYTDADMELISKSREKLFNIRDKRIHPYKDDKILTSWNGLMIAAMAIGGRILKDNEYTLAAENSVAFIYKNLIREDGRLLARYRDGETASLAFVDDYAFLIWGLIELYETTYKPEYLSKAVNLNNDLLEYFWDNKNGGLFVYGNDSEQLITRPKQIYDGATPSGNSVSALNFIRLARLTGTHELEYKANELLNSFASTIQSYPRGYSLSLTSLMYIESSSKEIVIVGDKNNCETEKMLQVINESFEPFTISMLYSNEYKEIEKIAPFITDYYSVKEKPTAYVCENYSCKPPITDSKIFKHVMEL